MLQEIVQNTEMGKNTLDELMGLTHDQKLKDEMLRQRGSTAVSIRLPTQRWTPSVPRHTAKAPPQG